MRKIFVLILTAVSLVFADNTDEKLETLFKAKSIKFHCYGYTTINFQVPKAKPFSVETVKKNDNNMDYTITNIDLKNKKALLVGNNGSVEVGIIMHDAGISFINFRGVGIIYTTVFYNSDLKPVGVFNNEQFYYIESRHNDLFGSVYAEGDYGTAEVIETH